MIENFPVHLDFYTVPSYLMIDAGYNYDRLEEKMGWLEIDPKSIKHILITHQDTDHVGAIAALFGGSSFMTAIGAGAVNLSFIWMFSGLLVGGRKNTSSGNQEPGG